MPPKLPQILADLARPSVLWFGGISASFATGVSAWRGDNLVEAAALVAAAWAGVAGIYWGKAWELQKVGAQAAEVEKERARAPAAEIAAAAPPTTLPTAEERE